MNRTLRKRLGNRIGKLVVALIWGTGYLFGFSLVAILTFGLIYAEEFSVLIHGRQKPRGFPIFKRFDQFFLEAEYAALVGWIFISAVIYLVTL